MPFAGTTLRNSLSACGVRIGPADGRVPMPIMPSGTAHFSYPALDPASDFRPGNLIDKAGS